MEEVPVVGEGGTPKITSVVKTEKIKDPKRVAQGKKLAAISRQAKERKAKEREASIRNEERERCDEEGGSFLKYSSVFIPVVLFGGYYLFYLRKKEPEKKEEEPPEKKTAKNDEQEPDLECL